MARARRNVRRRSGRRLKGSLPVSMRGIGPRPARSRAGRSARGGRGPAGIGKRRRNGRGMVRRAVRRRIDNVSGSYQFTRAKRTTGRFKTTAMLNRTLLKGGQEHVIYNFRGTKIFDNNGYFPMDVPTALSGSNFVGLPVYVLSLNGINRVVREHWPFYRLHAWEDGPTPGQLFFRSVSGTSQNGTTQTLDPALRTMYSSMESAVAGNLDQGKAVLRYTDVQLNLWGATSKSTRFTVQVVKVATDACDPWRLELNRTTGFTPNLNEEGQQAWQELIKQYTFNPLTKIDYHNSKKFKVLKTYDVVIQPNQTTDGDGDPSVRTLKWFMKWDRLTKFQETVTTLNPVADEQRFFDNNMGMEMGTSAAGNTPASRSHLMLLIRATNYTAVNDYRPFNNARDGSFDLEFKSKWTSLD